MLVTFTGGSSGTWLAARIEAVAGEGLPHVERVAVVEDGPPPAGATWLLHGATSYDRYLTRVEHEALEARQPPLGRPEATRAALVLVRKSDAWWGLAQDERRELFEERSHHVATGLRYLPAIARRLHHSRDLGEPFDFLTWFEYAPADADGFGELVAELRVTEEWRYVEREVDIRLRREE